MPGRWVVSGVFLAGLACAGGPLAPPGDGGGGGGGGGAVTISADVSPGVTGMSVEITAPDLADTMLRNISIVGGVASGTLTLPAGGERTITVRAYDNRAIETHRGSATVDVLEGGNLTLEIVLDPLAGDVPIVVDVSSYVVTLAPDSGEIVVGENLALDVTVRDGTGAVANPAIGWGSTDQSIARVDTEGVVTGIAAGRATIVANYRGTVALATVVVAP